MADFLEERINELIKYGSSYTDDYAVDISITSGGQECRALVHPFPRRTFDISYLLDNDKTYAELQAIYHRAHGRYAGFRARCYDEYSSHGRTSTPTALDQPVDLVSTGVYQLKKLYGTDKAAGAAGYPARIIHKPVAGTVLAAIDGKTNTRFTTDTTTGRITFVNLAATINGISKATQAHIDYYSGGGAFSIGESFYVSGVVGMTQINGQRVTVVGTYASGCIVNLNTTAYSTYTSGGTINSNPQTGEVVTAGFEFDFPVRFNSSMPIGQDYPTLRAVDGVELIELLNP